MAKKEIDDAAIALKKEKDRVRMAAYRVRPILKKLEQNKLSITLKIVKKIRALKT